MSTAKVPCGCGQKCAFWGWAGVAALLLIGAAPGDFLWPKATAAILPPELQLKNQTTVIPAEIVSFITAEKKLADEIARQSNFKHSPDLENFFAAAKAGQIGDARRIYAGLMKSAQSAAPGSELRTPLLEIAKEIELAIDAFEEGNPDLVLALGKDFMKALPPGCIYFGGTDPGRGLPTALCRAPGDPFFVLSQNPLADPRYMDYLRYLYGGRLQIPTTNEFQECYAAYQSDITLRMEHDKLHPNEPRQVLPGEELTAQGGTLQITGLSAVMRVNGLIAKKVFDENPGREFYVEESFPLEWMKPYLTPSGIILKINRQPVPEITPETMDADHKFWGGVAERTIGNWITSDTTVKDVCHFCEKVYVRHDQSDFKGDPRFLQSPYAQKTYSKLRDSIASSIYQWRTDGPDAPKTGPETKARLLKEAEFASKQALALCPYSPEAVYHSMLLLSSQRRFEEARMILKLALAVDPKNPQFADWLSGLNRQQGGANPGR
jgi:tetratricopeptide (TPR) repeat protein